MSEPRRKWRFDGSTSTNATRDGGGARGRRGGGGLGPSRERDVPEGDMGARGGCSPPPSRRPDREGARCNLVDVRVSGDAIRRVFLLQSEC